jgi:hypothetical protein
MQIKRTAHIKLESVPRLPRKCVLPRIGHGSAGRRMGLGVDVQDEIHVRLLHHARVTTARRNGIVKRASWVRSPNDSDPT